jgi:hypothetical protein
MDEVIYLNIKPTYDCEDEIQVLTICPLASLAQGLRHHFFKVRT